MGVNLSINDVIDKNRLDSPTPWIILCEIKVKEPFTTTVIETLRIARNNEDVVFGGYTWPAYPFEIDVKHSAGNQPEVSVNITDYTQAIQGRLQAYKGIVGSEVDLLIVNSDSLDQPEEIREFFIVTGVSAKEYKIDVTLGAENVLALRFPRRTQSRDRCSWRYKSTECGYSGTRPTCDQSLDGPNGCRLHSNTLNFGGFPGISPGAHV